MLALRNSVAAAELDALSADICANVLDLSEVKNARIVSTYLHTGSEVRTGEIVETLLSQGKKVIVPITDKENKRLVFSELRAPEKELESGIFGIPEPRREFRRPISLEEADVVLVPGVAWDIRGYRLGYGAGYYDRSINSLHKRILTIGLAYELQVVESVPRTRYDRRADKLVTECRVITAPNFQQHY
jgi:5-formyltetrahydrofolate cyclo-ligase